jgi:hypothetical protein
MAIRRFFALTVILCLALFCYSTRAQTQPQGLGVLDASTMKRITQNNIGIELELNLLRLDPDLMKQTRFFNFFVELNNCDNPKISTEIASEFDYPGIKAFYQPREISVLSSVPDTFQAQFHGFVLGQYDFAKKAFPLNGTGNLPGPAQIPSSFRSDAATIYGAPVGFCRAVVGHFGNEIQPGPNEPNYDVPAANSMQIAIPPMTVPEVPLDEATARAYLDNPKNASRQIDLQVTFQILPQPLQIQQGSHGSLSGSTHVTFAAKVLKVEALNHNGGTPMATLYP